MYEQSYRIVTDIKKVNGAKLSDNLSTRFQSLYTSVKW